MFAYRRTAAVIAVSAGLLPLRAAPRAQESGDDIWTRVRAVYAGLKSYEDTGAVINEYGVDSVDKFPFAMRFSRSPRRFILDYNPQGARFVIWGDPDAFHTWWKTTGDQYDFPNPNNTGAFVGGPIRGTGQKIPTLLYAKASLLSDFSNLTDLVNDGTEAVSGHKCHRLMGITRDVYAATTKEVNVRKMTLWIDAESLLIRKVLEEWKPLPGTRSRVITTYEPRANMPIDDTRFAFKAPEGQ
jgi:outer membrane lipoprotein-sorting protein